MDNPEELASHMLAGIKKFPSREAITTTHDEAKDLAETAEKLHGLLRALPQQTSQLLQTADSGFAASGKWVDEAIEARTGQVKVVRAAAMVADWLGPHGEAIERTFVIRGHIRGWAHRWRKAEKGPAQVDSDPAFMTFASECLTQAGIEGDHETMIAKALASDWRTSA